MSDAGCSSKENKMPDWHEWWLDLHSPSCVANVENVMAARIRAARDKGCDGVDPDNVDSVRAYSACFWLLLIVSTITKMTTPTATPSRTR